MLQVFGLQHGGEPGAAAVVRRKPPTVAEAEALEQRAAALETENGRLLGALGEVLAGAVRAAAGGVSGILTEVSPLFICTHGTRVATILTNISSQSSK